MKQLTIIEQANNNQFTFYDNYLDTILREFQGFEYAEVRESIDDVAGDYGSVYITSKNGRRQPAIIGDLTGDDVFANRRLLLKALRQTGTPKLIKFTTYDDLNLQFEAEVKKYVNPYTHKVHTFMIEFVAPDWRFYEQDAKSYDVAQTSVRGGFEIPATIPIAITTSTSTDTTINNIIENDGNEASDPVFTITGPGTNFLIRNVTLDKQFTINTTLISSDSIVIDVKNRTVIKNDVDNVYSTIDGDFWSVAPGENELRFLIESDIDMTTNLNVTFRNAYNGI